MKPLVVAVVGPTAVGKTALSIALARRFGIPVLSADSRQFYREMCIGTAVPSREEQEDARHFFVHHLGIADDYDAGSYSIDALRLIRILHQKHPLVILCGGSGLYIDAVLKGMHDFPEVPEEVRQSWAIAFREKGLSFLQAELQRLDPGYFKRVDRRNPHRLIRALSISQVSGRPYSSFLEEKLPERPFRIHYLQIDAPREIIYRRIDTRVDVMMERGLLEEARLLWPYRELKALQTVGYQELFQYFSGKWSHDQAVDEIKKNSRRYAKRQLTWLRDAAPRTRIPYDADKQFACQLIENLL